MFGVGIASTDLRLDIGNDPFIPAAGIVLIHVGTDGERCSLRHSILDTCLGRARSTPYGLPTE